MSDPAIVIFDVGKTNKKVLLFNDQYEVLLEECVHFDETVDEDGFPCEDMNALTKWLEQKFSEILFKKDIDVKAVNFSAYGASLVYIDQRGNRIAPLYNYLKPYPQNLSSQFYDRHGGEAKIAKVTASPSLGSLNSGMQLYRLKYEQPKLFEGIAFALHLPQYLSYTLADVPASEITSIGCHTRLWNFQKNKYHSWVQKEGLDKKFPVILPSSSSIPTNFQGIEIEIGIGLHDSSAALIPYLSSFHEPFVLISTGTWCISLNPFNHTELSEGELKQDCLCYLTYEGKPVKASRLFAGYEHEQQVKRLADHFMKNVQAFQAIDYNVALIDESLSKRLGEEQIPFAEKDLNNFATYEEAYHHLIWDITSQQVKSTDLVLRGSAVKRIFVDGGFGKNSVFMNLLAKALPGLEICSATLVQGSALGAALAIHKSWNKNPLPTDLVD